MRNLFVFLFLILFMEKGFSAPIYNTRFFYYNKLSSIYGEEAKSILIEMFSKNAHIFGGACNPYEQTGLNQQSLYECNNGIHEFIAPAHTKKSVLKTYKLSSICTNLSNLNFIKKYSSNKSLYDYLYSLYYPIDPKPKFEEIFKKDTSNYHISYSLCMSEKWQRI